MHGKFWEQGKIEIYEIKTFFFVAVLNTRPNFMQYPFNGSCFKSEKTDGDQSQDDVLKLDATAEVDEFSKFLNEFEDEVLADNSKDEPAAPPKVKKPRIQTERKTVDGKRLRKKVKQPPPPDDRDIDVRIRPGDNGEGSDFRRKRSPPPYRKSPFRRSPNARARNSRQSPFGLNQDRNSRPKDPKSAESDRPKIETRREREERERREAEARRERERKDYEEKLAKLPTPERERLEARRKKFESKVSGSRSDLADENLFLHCNDAVWRIDIKFSYLL